MADTIVERTLRLLSAATKGPWGCGGQHGYFDIGKRHPGDSGWPSGIATVDARTNPNAANDAALIAEAPYLLAELSAELQLVQSWLKRTDEHNDRLLADLDKIRLERRDLQAEVQLLLTEKDELQWRLDSLDK